MCSEQAEVCYRNSSMTKDRTVIGRISLEPKGREQRW